MRFDEFGVLFVWWGVWSLSDQYLLPYSPWTESLAIVIGFTISRLFSSSTMNTSETLVSSDEGSETSIRINKSTTSMSKVGVYLGNLRIGRRTENE